MSQQKLEQFGKYLLLEKLATGGMAEVHLAKSIGAVGVNKFVAIKRILPQHVESQDYIDMFKE
jgi:serine/threonine-protein kinase